METNKMHHYSKLKNEIQNLLSMNNPQKQWKKAHELLNESFLTKEQLKIIGKIYFGDIKFKVKKRFNQRRSSIHS